MINRHLLDHDDDIPTTEKLLEPSRITIKYENKIENSGLKSELILDVLMEPFEMKLGFREIDFFNSLNARF